MDHDHVSTPRLFDAATAGLKLTDEEKTHLVLCNECKEVLAAFSRQYANNKGVLSPFQKHKSA
jgi:hypothetical protein